MNLPKFSKIILKKSINFLKNTRKYSQIHKYGNAAIINSLTNSPFYNRRFHSINEEKDELHENPKRSNSYLAVIRAIGSNVVSTAFKLVAYFMTQSSSMFAECLHGVADCINEALLLIGEKQSTYSPNKLYQYGYGRSPYIWSLVSAMGTFFMGCCLSVWHGVSSLHTPIESLELNYITILALIVPFCLDGYVLSKTLHQLYESKPEMIPVKLYFQNIKNPTLLSVIYEDLAACTSVIIGSIGIFSSYLTQNMIYDSLGSICIGTLLGGVSLRLIYINQKYLLGQAIDPKTEVEITAMIRSRRSVDFIKNIHTQWISPYAYSYKASIDLDGTYIATLLYDRYKGFFVDSHFKQDLAIYMSWYAEDVTRLVEQEINSLKSEIQMYFPEAAYIDLELGSNNSSITSLESKLDDEKKAVSSLMFLYEKYGTLDRLSLRKKINSFKTNRHQNKYAKPKMIAANPKTNKKNNPDSNTQE